MSGAWDAIVVGSGFGGAMAAWPLVEAGMRVLMLERGGWVGRGPENWTDRGAGLATPWFTKDSPYAVSTDAGRYEAGAWNCVGGQSVFYGGASYRFRPSDFGVREEICRESSARWPFGYDDIEPHYAMAERMLGVCGEPAAGDGWRSEPFPQRSPDLSSSSALIADAALRAGYTPSRIPLAISFDGRNASRRCTRCSTCDGYACAAEAKKDLSTGVIPELVARGMTLRTNAVCVRLHRAGSSIESVEIVDRIDGTRETLRAHRVILAAGTLATPHLVLASNLARVNPAGDAIGRYLTRHRNAVVLGAFIDPPNPSRAFDKQVAILDLYEKGGSIQQMTPPLGMVKAYLPPGLRELGARFVSHASGLIVIAEDEPRQSNGVRIDWGKRDRFGLPTLVVEHRYTRRDEDAARVLVRAARRILREAGAVLTIKHHIDTFSHALGTMRMGVDPSSSPLDGDGRFRGLDNLYVADGSALPRSAGLNPSLTIAANALRIGSTIAADAAPVRASAAVYAAVYPGLRARALPILNPR